MNVVDVVQMVAARCTSEEHILVPIDGSSLSFVDREGTRGLGAVGTYAQGGLGLKVVSALALSRSGVPIGVLRQVFWKRPAEQPTDRRPPSERPIDEKETKHWLDAIVTSANRIASAAGPAPRVTFLVDREGDSAALLCTLVGTGHGFIVRGNANRKVAGDDGRTRKLRTLLADQKALGSYVIELELGPSRARRLVELSLRVANIILPLKDPVTGRKVGIQLSAVHAQQLGNIPEGEEPLDWLLLTNAKITTFKQASAVVWDYKLRWRIEEFHRAWKSGHCNVEQSQLRSEQALRKWAIVLAAVASRVERLKLLARDSPNLLADVEFSEIELHALVLLKRRSKKKNESIPDTVPTMQQATQWVAELGGYTGKSSGGPPGTITISRGLFKLRAAADAIAAFLAKDDEEIG